MTTAPATIGPYKIERELGRGGMGEVYLASDTRLDQQGAIRTLPGQPGAGRGAAGQRSTLIDVALNE